MPISGSNMQSGMLPVAEDPIIELRDLNAGYGEIQVLWGIDMAVRRGGNTPLSGSKGAGKTTLMRAVSGVIPPHDRQNFSDGGDPSAATPTRNPAERSLPA